MLPSFSLLYYIPQLFLAFLHTSGIIHGDFKTANVLVKVESTKGRMDGGNAPKPVATTTTATA